MSDQTTNQPHRDRIRETLERRRRFPKCFAMWQERRLPLKSGIHKDIIAILGDQLEIKRLKQALNLYTVNIVYLNRAKKIGATRIDLDGNPCGVVTVDASMQAKVRLYQLKHDNRKKEPVEKPPPKRVGLAELRAAAARRKAQRGAGGMNDEPVIKKVRSVSLSSALTGRNLRTMVTRGNPRAAVSSRPE